MHEDEFTSVQQSKLDALCTEFEAAWQRGERPSLESVLDGLAASERSAVMPQLLLIELEYLQESHVVPDVSDYLARFPQDTTLLRLVLRAFEGEMPLAADRCAIHEQVGSVVGHYKLLEQIGEGGMGVVYMAEQLRPVRRRVALKIIKPGMDTKHVIGRFEAERQALAMMDHTNIARVFDAGCTDSGRPYFVMELVRGVPITDYCDLNKLETEQRLNLFIAVCQAVQHAHTKGIIHRDLKPTNVLVTLHDGVPVPKIIDFGVAKATGPQLTERTLFTAYGQMVGTPLYMSPEQAELSGLDVDTRSDIYSLGVLLYELLTGTTPFERQRMQAAAYDEMRRIIREEEPDKPSTRVSTMGEASIVASDRRSTDPTRLRQKLRGELDWIVMKSLAKDRNRRYLTASDLGMEVARYLNGEPVAAGPPSTSYRVRKFVTRYKSQVAVVIGFTALTLAAAVSSYLLYVRESKARQAAIATRVGLIVERNRARAERDRAEQERHRADQQTEQLNKRLYDLNIISAQSALDRNNVRQVISLLNDCPPERQRWEWNRLSHQLRHSISKEFSLPSQPFMGVIPSPNGSKMAVFGDDGMVRVIDSTSGKLLLEDAGVNRLVRSIAFSPNGELICVVRWNKQFQELSDFDASFRSDLRVLQLNDGKTRWQLDEPAALVGDAVFSPHGNTLVLWRGGNQPFHGCIELRSVDTGDVIWSAPVSQWAYSMCYSPNGQRLYLNFPSSFSVHKPSTITCWSTETRETIWSADRPTTSHIAISNDGQWLITGGPDHTVQIWDANTGAQTANLSHKMPLEPRWDRGEFSNASVLSFSHDGKQFLSRCGHYVTIWDWAQREPVATFEQPQSFNTHHTHFSADDQHIILADSRFGSSILVRDIVPLGPELLLKTNGSKVRAIQFTPDSRQLMSLDRHATLQSWDAVTGQVSEIDVSTKEVTGATIAPAGDYLATAGNDGIRVWTTKPRKLVQHWPDVSETKCLAFDQDGRRLAAGGKSLRVWDVSAGHLLFQRTQIDPVLDLAFIAGTDSLATIDDAGNVDLLAIDRQDVMRLRSESRSLPEKAADQSIECLDYDPRTRTIALALSNQIEIRDLEGNLNGTLNNDTLVRCVHFGADGSRLFVGDDAGVLSVWNVETGVKLLHLPTEHTAILFLAVSADGKTVATAGADGAVKLWETWRPDELWVTRRQMVREATRMVQAKYAESMSLEEVRASLKSDASIDDQMLPLVLEIANTLGLAR